SGLEARLGRFYVLGSHDYYQSRFASYAKYFSGHRSHVNAPKASTPELEAGLAAHGWQPLINETTLVNAPAGRIRLTGIDDPYLKRQDVQLIRRDDDEILAIGLVHTPDVVSEWFLAGFDLVVAGHTHAGQVRLPLAGALITNCSLPTALASGPHRIGNGWLHVSPGLGTGKFSPLRFNCRPEATVLELVHSSPPRASGRVG
ncbi:MAG: metallophosphoesterase, partial [Actinomycetota bacterium]|nr:metallophosphoesterase [Actinomycetota bacterium]